uniref:Uncharacterized protein n=1 Tax=Parascaris equorum TaxID=6256 RepID=A0A914RF44_PAREQ
MFYRISSSSCSVAQAFDAICKVSMAFYLNYHDAHVLGGILLFTQV